MFKFRKKKKKLVENDMRDKVLIINFDEAAYLEANPDVVEAIENGQFKDVQHHLEAFGLNEIKNRLRKFHKDFELYDEARYLEIFSDLNQHLEEKNYDSVFDHFCKVGYSEIIATENMFKRDNSQQIEYDKAFNIIAKSGHFDEEYYIKHNPDVVKAGKDPFSHYFYLGWKEGRKPNPWFEPTFYYNEYPDVKISKLDPLSHFILIGYAEGRLCAISNLSSLEIANVITDKFDSVFYLKNNLDILEAELDPLIHYIEIGWREGRKPNHWFDPIYYLEKHVDVKDANIEPLYHYLIQGNIENRIYSKQKIQVQQSIDSKSIPKINFDDTSNKYIEYKKYSEINLSIKAVTFYLPQFHPFPENDEWWGKGFTEWTNVTKSIPNYSGHYQPHLPIHNGFYDLRIPEVMMEQAKLAKNYGIYGFNFYYYWFDGKVLMQKPFDILLEHKEIDINFCITWANENWTRKWDGAENDILIAQNHSYDDSVKFIKSLYKYFEDERYIKIDNKPVLIIYRVDIIPNMKKTVDIWREEIKSAGFDGIYLICAQTFGIKSPTQYGFDASMEFPPHTSISDSIKEDVNIINENYDGNIYDYTQVVSNACKIDEPEYKLYRSAMLSWDNTARNQNNSNIFHNFSLLTYKQWISNLASNVFNNSKYSKDEKLIFINAWNEWAEGTHLEPDRKFGYGYLQTTYDVLKNFEKKHLKKLHKKINKKNDIAIILHIHYTDIWKEINMYLSNLDTHGFDLYVTVTNTENKIIKKIINKYPKANIKIVENRGRDILPFIETYNSIKKLKYKYICKIHSKKSTYRLDGDIIRNEIYDTLLGKKNSIKTILSMFDKNNTLGILCSEKYLIKHTTHNMTYDEDIVNDIASFLGFKFEYYYFPAGTMFWCRPEALSGIENIKNNFFDIEEGLSDGTVAHGIERILGNLAKNNNYTLQGI